MSVKTPEHQALQGLHRIRAQWMRTRQARINLMRGLLRELGVVIPQGARTALARIPELIEDAEAEIPDTMRALLFEVLAEVRDLEQRLAGIERELQRYACPESDARHLMQVPGVGLLTATTMVAAVPDPSLFRNARHFASWLGLTPRESSNGQRRRVGGISKRGNTYLRTLLIHGTVLVSCRQSGIDRPRGAAALQGASSRRVKAASAAPESVPVGDPTRRGPSGAWPVGQCRCLRGLRAPRAREMRAHAPGSRPTCRRVLLG